ncbi:diffusible signal factor-reguated Ax21 faimly protein [Noviluteimonas dokdonensis]|nr:diffusible signal factor-reguated Ax21 faimly protein [Lysobacter dokdonensis]
MRCSLFALVLLAAAPFTASATDVLSYDYVEAGYVKSDSRDDASGYGITGSVSIDERFNLFGSYVDQNSDRFNGVDLRQWSVGAGFHHSVKDNVDLVARLAWNSVDTAQTKEYDGVSAEAGVRAAMGAHFETWALAGYGDVDAGNGEFYGRLGAQAKFGKHFGLAGDVKLISGDTQWFVGPRFSW